MILAVVKGNVVSTNKTEKLQGGKLLIVEEWDIEKHCPVGQPRVALDLMGAGEGELVMCVSGSSSRQTEQTEKRPVDMAIIGIVDQVEIGGSICYKKYENEAILTEKAAKPESAAPAAEPESAAPAAEPESAAPAAEPEPVAPAAEPVVETPAKEQGGRFQDFVKEGRRSGRSGRKR